MAFLKYNGDTLREAEDFNMEELKTTAPTLSVEIGVNCELSKKNEIGMVVMNLLNAKYKTDFRSYLPISFRTESVKIDGKDVILFREIHFQFQKQTNFY